MGCAADCVDSSGWRAAAASAGRAMHSHALVQACPPLVTREDLPREVAGCTIDMRIRICHRKPSLRRVQFRIRTSGNGRNTGWFEMPSSVQLPEALRPCVHMFYRDDEVRLDSYVCIPGPTPVFKVAPTSLEDAPSRAGRSDGALTAPTSTLPQSRAASARTRKPSPRRSRRRDEPPQVDECQHRPDSAPGTSDRGAETVNVTKILSRQDARLSQPAGSQRKQWSAEEVLTKLWDQSDAAHEAPVHDASLEQSTRHELVPQVDDCEDEGALLSEPDVKRAQGPGDLVSDLDSNLDSNLASDLASNLASDLASGLTSAPSLPPVPPQLPSQRPQPAPARPRIESLRIFRPAAALAPKQPCVARTPRSAAWGVTSAHKAAPLRPDTARAAAIDALGVLTPEDMRRVLETKAQ